MHDMTAAEFAAHRRLTGLTLDQLAAHMRVNPRTVRSWESGRDAVSDRIAELMASLVERHRNAARGMASAGVPIVLPRYDGSEAEFPRGWYLAAASSALLLEPEIELEWDIDVEP